MRQKKKDLTLRNKNNGGKVSFVCILMQTTLLVLSLLEAVHNF